MTGGSKSSFLVRFALSQLNSNRKSGFHNMFPTGSQWKVAHIGQKTHSSPENDVKEGVSEEADSEEVDYLDSYKSSPWDGYCEGKHI